MSKEKKYSVVFVKSQNSENFLPSGIFKHEHEAVDYADVSKFETRIKKLGYLECLKLCRKSVVPVIHI